MNMWLNEWVIARDRLQECIHTFLDEPSRFCVLEQSNAFGEPLKLRSMFGSSSMMISLWSHSRVSTVAADA